MLNLILTQESVVEEGNELLKACAKKMHIPIFTQGQQKVELGLKRKSVLQKEIDTLEKRKKNCSQRHLIIQLFLIFC